MAINVEAGELLEEFLWKEYDKANIEKVKEELADVFAFSFLLAEKYNLNVKRILIEKIEKMGRNIPFRNQKELQKNIINCNHGYIFSKLFY